MKKIKWFKVIWDLGLVPILGGVLWHYGFESIVIWSMLLSLSAIIGYLNPSEFKN